jgi:ATP-dependent protease ClpP protease subunit
MNSNRFNTNIIEEQEEIITNISVIDNNIYFYDEINKITALKLRSELQTIINKNKHLSLIYKCEPIPIYLFLNSDGGEVSCSLAIVDLILSSDVPIYTIIEGEVCSAATLISIVGTKRFITKNSHMLIHQVRGGLWGKMAEFEDEMKNMKTYNDKLVKLYKQFTNLTEEKLTKIMKKDISWNSKKCIKYGLVDEYYNYSSS